MQQGFRISDWRVEPQLNTLTGPEKTAHLEPKVMQVLLCLAEQPGQVILKERLIQRVWPDTFVSDDVLTRSISELRRAFGDDAKEPRFIQTIPRSGYRLIARVFSTDAERGIAPPEQVATSESVDESRPRSLIAPVNDGSAASGLGIAAASERSKSSFLRPWVAIAFLSPIVLAFLVWALGQYPARRTEVIERKLTGNSSENSVTSMAISPDGRHLAYADNTGIFLKLIHTGEIHLVTLPPHFSAGVDDWFPDGSHLLICRAEQPGKASLWSISVFGGAPRQLADDASGGSLSPDGSHIAFRRGDLTHDGRWGREEWVMRSDGTDLVKVAAGKSDSSEVGAPTWSPDGKRIAYIRSDWAYNARTSSVEVNEWQRATAETLFSDSRLGAALHWLPDGRLIYAFGSAQHQQESYLFTRRKVAGPRWAGARVGEDLVSGTSAV